MSATMTNVGTSAFTGTKIRSADAASRKPSAKMQTEVVKRGPK